MKRSQRKFNWIAFLAFIFIMIALAMSGCGRSSGEIEGVSIPEEEVPELPNLPIVDDPIDAPEDDVIDITPEPEIEVPTPPDEPKKCWHIHKYKHIIYVHNHLKCHKHRRHVHRRLHERHEHDD